MLVGKLMQVAERLEVFPASGRVVPEIGDESLREVIYRNYRIVYMYLPNEELVEVLTVFHSSRQFGTLPGETS